MARTKLFKERVRRNEVQTETDDGIVVPCIIGRQSIESTDSLRSQVPPQVIAARRSTESLTAVGTAYAPDCGECADLVRQPRSGIYLPSVYSLADARGEMAA